MPGRREETPFFMADGPAHSRDMGFRPVISGINTPGGNRPEELQAEWNKAGESLAAAGYDTQAARNPLEERQRQLEAQSLLRTGVYMTETIRNYSIRRKSLQSQIESMQRDSKSAKSAELEKLRQIMDTAHRGLVMLDTSLDKSLTFYRSKVEDGAQLAPGTLSAAYDSLSKDFNSSDPFNENMRLNLELYRRHVDLFRKNKALPREAMLKEILERRFQ